MGSATEELAVMVRGLTKSYHGRTVVDDVDLEVRFGEVLGIVGANGAGKTTTVECLQGLRRPDQGRLRVLGLDPTVDVDGLRPQLGSQLQSAGLPERLRVDEAITLFAGPRSAPGDELLERFGLARRRRSPYGDMSGGERQRLFLVLALLNQPRLVVLDELTQGLDPSARREVWAAVAQLRESGTTVVLVTHEVDAVEALCDRVVVMRGGRVVEEGSPNALLQRHGAQATVRFTWPAGAAGAPAVREQLERLAGVEAVDWRGGQVVVRGSRAMVAHVGGWLVGGGEPVPDDLHVTTPGLESALLALFEVSGTTRGSAR